MARVKRSVHAKKKRRVTLERAKGYYGNKSRSCRAANEQVMHSLQYAYRDRRARKGDFRRLWIQRINAACRQNGMSYSRFVAGLRLAGVEVDRKVLADLAVTDEAAFRALAETAAKALEDAEPASSLGLIGRRWPSRSAPDTTACSDCGASRGAAVRVPARAPSSSTGPTLLAEALDAGVVVDEVVAEPGCPEALLAEAAAAGATVRRAAAGALARAVDTVTPHGGGRRGPHAPTSHRGRRPGGGRPAGARARRRVRPRQRRARCCARPRRRAPARCVFCDGSVDPFGPKCVRSSAGSVLRLAVARDGDSADALAALRRARAAAPWAPWSGRRTPYDTVDLAGPVALVLGNEAHGLPPTPWPRRSTRPSRSPWRAAPSRSTWPWRARSCASRRCASAVPLRPALEQGDRLPMDRHLPNRDAPGTGVDL